MNGIHSQREVFSRRNLVEGVDDGRPSLKRTKSDESTDEQLRESKSRAGATLMQRGQIANKFKETFSSLLHQSVVCFSENNAEDEDGDGEWTISMSDLEVMYNAAVTKWNTSRQRSLLFSNSFAKDIYLYFVRDFGPTYFLDLVDGNRDRAGSKAFRDAEKKTINVQRDLELRRSIVSFVSKFYNTSSKSLMISLNDIGKQKRKDQRQKQERLLKQNECKKCFKKCKNGTECENHEKTCRKNLAKQNSRSKRKRKSAKELEQRKHNQEKKLIESEQFTGLFIESSKKKGRCLVARRPFRKGDLICSYQGELIQGQKNIDIRNSMYNKEYDNEETAASLPGSYMYYYKFQNENFCIDATKAHTTYGRTANHSRKNPNAYVEIFQFNPNEKKKLDKHIPVLRAKRNIGRGEEILYDYGTYCKDDLKNFPWLNTT